MLQALKRMARSMPAEPNAPAVDVAAAFCCTGQLAIDALSVAVQDVGKLEAPLTSDAAKALASLSEPAHYGHREATLLNTKVRNTGEIRGDALQLHWGDGALAGVESEVARALGLPGVELRLHNLLAYGPGQFFKPHQDTERHATMVGTLVLVWPSAHIGGELRIRHAGQEARFSSQHLRTPSMRWFAFYADCQHEVLPVEEGWRIVLTFDLLVRAVRDSPRASASRPILKALRTLFQDEDRPRLKPWVFLLEHEYSERGLRWSALKGADRPRVAALRAAADELGLVASLALAEIHELWSATGESAWQRGKAREPEPEELLDEDMVLNYWVDTDERPPRRGALTVARTDAISCTETNDAFLVDQAYEGYMGNYGETLEYWYRRAALVIQSPLAAEASRFDTDFDGALADALALARAGRGDELAQRLRAAVATIESQRRTRGRSLLGAYAELAGALPDGDLARALCEGFEWAELQPEDGVAIGRLVNRWGRAWVHELLGSFVRRRALWSAPRSPADGGKVSPPWPHPPQAFLHGCRRAGLDAEVIADLMEHCLRALTAADSALVGQVPARRQASLPNRVAAVAELAAALLESPQADHLTGALVGHVRSLPSLYPLTRLRPLLEVWTASAARPAAVQSLHDAAVDALRRALARPEPSSDDFSSSDIEWICRCQDCSPVIRWAESPIAHPLVLAMAEARRGHVTTQLQGAAAPFGVETVKQGSPYKLVVSKPSDLPARQRAQRKIWADDLTALAHATVHEAG